jgi:hypothetical protein
MGWLKRKDFVFLVNSLVKEMAPRTIEKIIGRMYLIAELCN